MPPRAAPLLRIRPVILAASPNGEHKFVEALTRVADRNLYEAPLIIADIVQRDTIAETLKRLAITDAVVIVEPEYKNTAASMLMASFFAHTHGEEMLQLILPAEDVIDDAELFHDSIKSGMNAAGHGFIVLFGLTPEHAEMRYGYIVAGGESDDTGLYSIDRFPEKLPADGAHAYINSGVYLYHPRVFQGEMVATDKEYYHQCGAIWNKVKRDLADAHQVAYYHLPQAEYTALQTITIEKLLMAKTRQAVMIRLSLASDDEAITKETTSA